MKILLIASQGEQNRFFQKFASLTDSTVSVESLVDNTTSLNDFQLIFDFEASRCPENLDYYQSYPHLCVWVNAVFCQLASLCPTKPSFALGGFNGLPYFLVTKVLEISAYAESHQPILAKSLELLQTEYAWVADRVGMVTPRIIAMIVNEAFYTLQEKTASRHDIDISMKLGTNYPFGPFEWAEKIGLENIYQLLNTVYQDTHDERYRICPLLKTEMLTHK